MASFSVIILTAPPTGQAAEAGGAYVKIDGREALVRSIELFLNRESIQQIILAVPADETEEIKRRHGAHLSFSGVKLAIGGPKWLDQLAAAQKLIKPESTHVLIHDAARPIVPYYDIDTVLEAAESHPAITLTTPVRASLIQTNEAGKPVSLHSASDFVQMLTPRCFDKATFDSIATTRQWPKPEALHLVKGSPLNLRIGGNGDANLAKGLLAMLPKPKKKAAGPFEEAQW